MIRPTSVAALLFALATAAVGVAQPSGGPKAEDPTERLASHVVEEYRRRKSVPSVAIAVVTPSGSFVRGYGKRGNGAAVDGDTSFSIGSVTKVFTSTLLALEVQSGEVSLDDRVVRFLPEAVERRGHSIRRVTLGELATFTAGLPRDPPPEFRADPAEVLRFVTRWEASHERPIGTWLYSNLSYGVLGYALQHRAGRPLSPESYAALLRPRLLDRLGMSRTRVFPGDENRATGYQGERATDGIWRNAWYAAGSLSSTANDMRRFLEAAMQRPDTPPQIASAMKLAQEARVYPRGRNFGQGLAWRRSEPDGRLVIEKEGSVEGFTACVAWMPGDDVGVALLANQGESDACRPATALLLRLARMPD